MLSIKEKLDFGYKLCEIYFYNEHEDNVEEIATEMAKEELNKCNEDNFEEYKEVYESKIQTFKYYPVFAGTIKHMVISGSSAKIYVEDDYYIQDALENQEIPYIYYNNANGVRYFEISKKDFDKLEKINLLK